MTFSDKDYISQDFEGTCLIQQFICRSEVNIFTACLSDAFLDKLYFLKARPSCFCLILGKFCNTFGV